MSEHVCAKKKVYYTKSSAKKASKGRRNRYWYECEHCGFFHLSKLSQKEYEQKKHYYKTISRM